MSITASSLIALVEARGAKEATAQLLEVGAASDTAGTKIKNLATDGLLVAGAAAIGFGAASVKMAGDFEQSTNLLITSAGEVPKNIDMIRQGLLKMSVDTATPVQQLVKGMFNIESAGYHGAAALQVEKAAAQGAKVENADLATTTGILVTAMHDFHEPASQAVDVMNSFRMAASMGVMHLDDLNAALKNVLPIASQAGVSLTDVEAALSTMSLAGDKGASAGTHLSQMLTYLLAPSSKATGALKEVGLTTQQISDEMKISLPDTIKMITDAVGEKFPVGSAKYIAALSAIVGGNKSMKAMLELSGISLKTFTDDANKLAPTLKANSTAVDGWTTVQSNLNFKLDAAKNAVEALMISVGEKLLPVVGKLADDVTPLIQSFSDWVTAGGKVSDQLGVLQPAFQAVHDILPDISTFLTQAGDDIASNLLPPLESLITNVGLVVSDFATWLDKSGTASTVLSILGGTIQATTAVLGTLIQGMSDIVGWFEQGGLQGQVLAGVVAGLGAAFVAIKIADTVSGFQKLYATWSAGEGILTNLASAVKGKLSQAIDDFLANQAPNLKASMDGIKNSAAEAATAEEAVSAAPADESAAGWFARLEESLVGVEEQAAATGGAVESIGTDAEAAAVQVGTSTTTMDAELAATETTAAGASAGIAGVGTAALLAAGPIIAFGAIFVATYELIKNKAYDTNKAVQTSTGEMVQANQLRWHQLATGATASAQQISNSASTTDDNVKQRFADLAKNSQNSVQTLSDNAIAMFARLNTQGTQQMQSLDQSAISYWNDVAQYINDHPLNFNNEPFSPGQNKLADKNQGYASGTDSAPGGPALVGERGAELVLGPRYGDLPQGSRVIPHDQTMSLLGGGLGGGNNQPIHVHIEVGGHEVLSYLIDQMGNAMMQQSILQYGGRRW